MLRPLLALYTEGTMAKNAALVDPSVCVTKLNMDTCTTRASNRATHARLLARAHTQWFCVRGMTIARPAAAHPLGCVTIDTLGQPTHT